MVARGARNTRWRFGIGARLGSAFVLIVGLAIGACFVGWISYGRLSGELSHITETEFPELAFAARLSKAGADVGSITAALANAETRANYKQVRRIYAERLQTLQKLLEEHSHNATAVTLLPLAKAIDDNLAKIDTTAGKRFTLAEVMRGDVDELRWVQADLLEEAAPLVDDIRFNIEIAMKGGKRDVALAEQRKSEALLTVVSHANLATGLIARLVSSSTVEEMQETDAFLGDSVDELATRLKTLSGWPDSLTVDQLAHVILQQANPATGTPNRKRSEMREAARLGELAKENSGLVAELGHRIEKGVVAIEASAKEAAKRAAYAIDVGRRLLAAIAALAVVLASIIGIFYVHRSLLARIRRLAGAADAMSAGQAAVSIPEGGDDELGDLAHALILFRQTRDELIQSAKLAALGQMAAGIGHELNQPLAAIRAHIHSAKTLISRDRSQQALTSLEKIGSLTGRIAGQISHIRRFARRPDAKLQSVDLKDAVCGALSLLEHRFEEEDIALDLSLAEGAVPVMAEPVRLEQVAVNLIANAIDAVENCSVRKISIAVARTPEGATLLVADNGSGIAPENHDSIFDPFFTTKPVGSGLGLGLSISYNILKDFDASIAVSRTGPEGTSFVVSLKGAI